MIDTATIFFSTLMCLVVVFRAIKLDGRMPWFGVPAKRRGPWDRHMKGEEFPPAINGRSDNRDVSDAP
jgi:hypothetical protein